MNPIPNEPTIPAPTVWYLAAGYKLPAGIEAYLLHYATELRRQGFVPRIIVFEPLPKVPHRFLVALRERGIPIESLYERVRWRAQVLAWITYVPWVVRKMVGEKVIGYSLFVNCEDRDNRLNSPNNQSPITNNLITDRAPNNQSRITNNYASLLHHWLKRLAVRELKKMIEREHPDIIHVKGRIICEALPVLPSERTIYQHALMGTRDPSWTDSEAKAFSAFLNRIARVLVQGKRIAETFARSFNINRPIDVVFTMAPDELAPAAREKLLSCQVAELSPRGELSSCSVAQLLSERPEVSLPSSTEQPNNSTTGTAPTAVLRFGILCRFTEQKGIPFILEALKTFREKHGQVDFTFAGQGPLESVIREACRGDGVTECRSGRQEEGRDQRSEARDQRSDFNVGAALRSGEEKSGTEESPVGTPAPTLKSKVYGLMSKVSPSGTAPPTLKSKVYGLMSKVSPPGIRIISVESAVNVLEELDVFVHPGLDDAMPVSIVEALMCGVSCIVSDVGASPELVRDGVEGRVIKPASSEEIFEAMEWFAALSADELAALKARARLRYEECCTPARVGAQVAAIYRDVIGKCVRRDVERHLTTH